jgi:hypothetical protein
MRTVRNSFFVTVLGLVVAMPAAWAQQQSQDQSDQPAQPAQPAQPVQPIPALRSPLASAAGNGDSQTSDQDSQPLSPDTRPLAGAQDLSLGSPTGTHSYWEPQAVVTSTFDSNPLITSGGGGVTVWTSFLGGIEVHRNSENSNLILSYLGGGSISNNGAAGNAVFQQFGLVEQLAWGRSTITFFDTLSYLPESAFGFAGATGVPLPGGGTVGLQNPFVPEQGILTAQSQRIANTFIAEDQIQLTPRSSLTFLGGYNLLHYFGTNLLNADGFMFQGGYNYLITREDTISLFYRFNEFDYSNFHQSISNNSVQASYGRRVTGRLALRVGGGPSFSNFQTPITTSGSSGTGSGTTTGPTSQVYFAVSAGLIYQAERTGFTFFYDRGIGGGSGVLAGSVSNFLSGSATRQFSQNVQGGLNFGYSRNSGLGIGIITPTDQTFNYTYVGANLSRRWGRSTTLSLSYQLQYQNSSIPPCVGAGCGTNCTGVACSTSFVRHAVFLSLNWKTQPLAF